MEEKKVLLVIDGLGEIITTEDKIVELHDIFSYASSQAWSFYNDTDVEAFHEKSADFNHYACEMHKYLNW